MSNPLVPTDFVYCYIIMQMERQVSIRSPQRKRIQWRAVFADQDYASIFMTILAIIALIIFSTVVQDPASQSFLVYDATISKIYNPNSSIPFAVACIVPLVCLLLSLGVLEIYLASAFNFSLTSAVAATVHFIIDFVCTGVVTGVITEVTKLLVGRLRPDFLNRCNPPVPSTVTIGIALPPPDNPQCNSSLSASKLEDGHKSFPSGHASTAFSLGVYVAGYVLWATFYRPSRKYFTADKDPSFVKRIMREITYSLAFFWIIFQLGWACEFCSFLFTKFYH